MDSIFYLTEFFSVNRSRKSFVVKGRLKTVKTKEYNSWIKTNSQLIQYSKFKKQFSEPVEVEIKCYFKDKRKRDIDNCIKGILDLLTTTGILSDDSIVFKVSAEKTYDRLHDDFDVQVVIKEYEGNYQKALF